MDIKWSGGKRNRSLSVSGPVLIGDVGDLKRALLDCLESKGAVTIDLDGVDDCDTAGAQLLAAFFRNASGKGVEIATSAVSSAVYAAVDRAAMTFDEWPGGGGEVRLV